MMATRHTSMTGIDGISTSLASSERAYGRDSRRCQVAKWQLLAALANSQG
jgi:hypothetical protein